MSDIVLAIVGYREYDDYEQFSICVNEWITELTSNGGKVVKLVSGGASGTDAMAERFARDHNYTIQVFAPQWSKGKHAGLLRNTDIVNASTHVMAFLSDASVGTRDTIKKAYQFNRVVKTIYV